MSYLPGETCLPKVTASSFLHWTGHECSSILYKKGQLQQEKLKATHLIRSCNLEVIGQFPGKQVSDEL